MPSNKTLTFTVGAKGGVCARGLQRFPVTLYFEQWLTLLTHAEELKQFITDHMSELAVYSPKEKTADSSKNPDAKFSLTKDEIAAIDPIVAKLTEDLDMPQAVKIATIKALAEGGNKVTFEQYKLVFEAIQAHKAAQ